MVVHICRPGTWEAERADPQVQNQGLERSVITNTGCFPRGPGRLNPKHPHAGSRLSVTPVPGSPQGIQVLHRHTLGPNTHTHIQLKKKKSQGQPLLLNKHAASQGL